MATQELLQQLRKKHGRSPASGVSTFSIIHSPMAAWWMKPRGERNSCDLRLRGPVVKPLLERQNGWTTWYYGQEAEVRRESRDRSRR